MGSASPPPEMSTNEDASSSSEDEAVAAALREACDEKFLPESLFAEKNSSIALSHATERAIDEETKPSLRVTDDCSIFENFGVSQSFKDFVAKKLVEKLERFIELRDGRNEDEPSEKKRKKKKKQRSNPDAGIKLLSSSENRIVEVEVPEEERPRSTIKSWKYSKRREFDNVVRCRDVAVNPERILSKIETEAWTERPRGTVFKYRKGCDGVLIEQKQ